MSPAIRSDATVTPINITNNDDNTTRSCVVVIDDTKKEVQRNGFFSRFRRLRGGRRVAAVQVTDDTTKEGTTLDESITVNETDDEDSSFSFSSRENDDDNDDIIDQLLSRKPIVVVLDNVDKVNKKSTQIQAATTKHQVITSYDELGLPNFEDNNSSSLSNLLSSSSSSSLSIHSCLKLLSSHDLDQNRLGLQRLILLTKGRTLSGLGLCNNDIDIDNQSSSEEEGRNIVSQILVFGGEFGSIEEQLRYIFATMICNSPHSDNHNQNQNHNYNEYNKNDDDDDDDGSDYDYDDDDYYGGDYFEDYRNEEEALFDWILEYNPNEVQVNLDNTNNNNNNGNGIGNSIGNNGYNDEESSSTTSYSCYSSSSSFSDQQLKKKMKHLSQQQYPEGKANGILHNHALRVLANALENVLSSSTTTTSSTSSTTPTPMSLLVVDDNNISPIWKNIIHSLVNNIQRPDRNWNATGYSLKILRLLYKIMNVNDDTVTTADDNNNNMILPLLRHSLFTQLVYLIEYGKSHHFPMIYKEASYLLRLCAKS